MILGLLAAFAIHTTYPRAMVVDTIDYKADVVYCIDAVGYEWKYYGTEDYMKGDVVICTMNDNGTKDIKDDKIEGVVWSGYWIDEEGRINHDN